jgi:drug/metabolite transporter, DME family
MLISEKNDKGSLQGLLFATFATFCWALTGVFIRLLDMPSSSLIIFIRLIIAALFIMPFAIYDKNALTQAIRSPLSFLMALYYIFSTEAFIRSTIAEVVLIVGLTPLIVIFIERYNSQKININSIYGASIVVIGLAAFIFPSLNKFDEQRLLGDLFAFGAAIVSAAFAVSIRRRNLNNKPLKIISLTFVTFCYGIILSGCIVYLDNSIYNMNLSLDNIVSLLALGIISTALPTISYGIAATRLSSVTTASLTLLTPIWATVIGGIFISEWPSPLSIPGGIITLLGLWFIIQKNKKIRTRT